MMHPLSRIGVALVEPEFAINVGYVARSMANFGIKNLYIVSPNTSSQKMDLDRASMFSSHGHEIVEGIKKVESIQYLRKSYQILVGTTAIRGKRKSNITRKTMDLDKFSLIARKAINTRSRSKNSKLCLIFGRDTTGLTNEELKTCDYAITVSTDTEYNTLNISHAASIIFYVLAKSLKAKEDSSRSNTFQRQKLAITREKRQLLLTLISDLAEKSDFQKHKRSKLLESVTRMVNRSDPSLKELYLLIGLVSKAKTKIQILSRVQDPR
jgi:tRNA/rRNA methyltransferase